MIHNHEVESSSLSLATEEQGVTMIRSSLFAFTPCKRRFSATFIGSSVDFFEPHAEYGRLSDSAASRIRGDTPIFFAGDLSTVHGARESGPCCVADKHRSFAGSGNDRPARCRCRRRPPCTADRTGLRRAFEGARPGPDESRGWRPKRRIPPTDSPFVCNLHRCGKLVSSNERKL